VVAESLTALGAGAAFGVPGIHALAIWEALRDSPVALYGARTELCAGFTADGYARSSGRPAPLLLSTGPGALNSLTAIMEGASSHVPLVAIASHIPSHLIGRGRGYLHDLPDQMASFRPLVKYAARVPSVHAIPGVLAEAWTVALAPPSGPVYVEIPVDVLSAAAGDLPPACGLSPRVRPRAAASRAVRRAAELLAGARRPLIWAGGGTVRARASEELLALAEVLQAPVATTYMGKGVIPDDHPLAAGCGCDEAALQELLRDADVVLCVGTELGAETTGQYTLEFSGRLIHLDAAPERIGASYPSVALVGDARLTLSALGAALRAARAGPATGEGIGEGIVNRVAALRGRIRAGLKAQGRGLELGLLATIEAVLPADAITTWDMTILAYWAAPHLRIACGQQFLYPLGSGTLGYAWPAALGAAIAHPGRRALAVVGDGGIQYALAELGTAAQHRIRATLLIVDDGGYGILREYQQAQFGRTTSVELPGLNLPAVVAGFGVPVRESRPDDLAEQLAWAFAQDGPAAVVLRTRLTAAAPTP
jgi:acetolactate synthase-1/2/3 large subunit